MKKRTTKTSKKMKTYKIEFEKLTPIEEMKGVNSEESKLLILLKDRAIKYLSNKKWCKKIIKGYFGYGIGKIIAIFLFKLDPIANDIDNFTWIIVGDLPPAFLSPVYCKNPKDALNGYIGEMTAWVKAVKHNKPVDKLIPVNSPATLEYAKMLESRLVFLNEKISPLI
jgi:hypothetical protein